MLERTAPPAEHQDAENGENEPDHGTGKNPGAGAVGRKRGYTRAKYRRGERYTRDNANSLLSSGAHQRPLGCISPEQCDFSATNSDAD
jgi:hypothetical protein